MEIAEEKEGCVVGVRIWDTVLGRVCAVTFSVTKTRRVECFSRDSQSVQRR